jgi:putative transposase
MASLFCETLSRYQREGKIFLHEFVVMPNHFHLLLTVPRGLTLERVMQYIKGGFSYQARKLFEISGEIWQTSFLDRRVRDSAEYSRFRTYIRQNPVRAGLVQEADEFLYSSANLAAKLDPVPQWLKPEHDEAGFVQA